MEKVLVSLSIILLVFGDSQLQKTVLGIFGANLSFIPLVVLLLYLTYIEITKIKVNKMLIMYVILILVSSCFGVVLFFYNFSYLDFFKYFIIYSVLFVPLVINLKYKLYAYIFLFSFLVTGFSFLIPNISEITFFHGTENGNMRFRGLYSEASYYAATFSALWAIVTIYFRKNFFLIVLLSLFSFYVLFFVVYSKGILIAFALSLVLAVILNLRFNVKSIMFSLLVFSIIVLFTLFIVLPKLTMYFEVEKLTSLSTRLMGVLAGFYSLFIFPFGVGYTGYKEALISIYSFLRDWEYISFFEFSEIDSYISHESTAVSTKNFFSDWFVFFGVPGALFIYFYFNRIWSDVKDDYLLSFSLVLLLLMLATFVNGIGLYALSFLLGVIVSHARTN